jgi:ArsR family transcriptional regulator, arsenate/arsenite/antimonite-responsive transcriptional repressor
MEANLMNSIEEVTALQIARVPGDPVRFTIYKHIIEAQEIRCGDICLQPPVEASTVSHHLKVLLYAGLVESRRIGQGVYYRAIFGRLEAYLKYLKKIKHMGQEVRNGSAPTASRRDDWQRQRQATYDPVCLC